MQMTMLVKGMAERGCCCEVFLLEAVGPLIAELRSVGVVVHDGGYVSSASRWKKIFFLIRAAIRLYLHVLRSKPQILHAYLPLTNFLGALVGCFSRTSMVITSRRALGTHQDKRAIWKWLDRISSKLSHIVTMNSVAVLRDAIRRDKIDQTKSHVIYNGLDVEKYEASQDIRMLIRDKLNLAENEVAIVSVGNYLPYKGHSDLLRAVPLVLESEVNIRLLLVGEDRGIGRQLKELACELGIDGRVIFYGNSNEVARLLSAMDIFVLPSHEEGFSNALLEAMAAGLPIVATDVGGNSEALEGGFAGILAPPHCPDSLSGSISQLIADKKLRRQFGDRAKEVVRNKYSRETMIDNYTSLYMQALGVY